MQHSHTSSLESEVKVKALKVHYKSSSAEIYWCAGLDTCIFPPQNQYGTDGSVANTKQLQKCLQEWVLSVQWSIGLPVHLTEDAILCLCKEWGTVPWASSCSCRDKCCSQFFGNKMSISEFSCLTGEVKQSPVCKEPLSVCSHMKELWDLSFTAPELRVWLEVLWVLYNFTGLGSHLSCSSLSFQHFSASSSLGFTAQ